MTYIKDRSSYLWKDKNPIDVICDQCKNIFNVQFRNAEKNFKKNNGKHVCSKCKGQPERPQCSSDYWTKEKREYHSESLKNSEKYKKAIEARDLSGEKNGMHGKVHTKETRKKMSQARTGKLGPNATAWKGGKSSLTRRVKKAVHCRFNWYYNVYKRDNWTCQKCDSKKQIDAHHIEPIYKIIKRLTQDLTFDTDEDKIEWLLTQDEIVDSKLKNGITLCRECHKKEHSNWGSHNPEVRKKK